MPRTIAIGDIHGCSTAQAKLIELIDPQPDDVLVPLGDFVDRGIDSKGVIEQLISLADRCRLVPILGNHEEMMLGAREGRSDFRFCQRAILQVHPRGDQKNPLTGVFATRSPFRPNLIALSLCKIVSVKENVIEVEKIDAFEGTPVLDIKPYAPGQDSATGVKVPEWAKPK